MTFRFSRKFSRRRFLATAAATGTGALSSLAMPYLSRAADRPLITHGVQSGDVGADGGVVWARADRASQMMVEVATTDSFKDARVLPPIAALPESDFTAKMLLENLPADGKIWKNITIEEKAKVAETLGVAGTSAASVPSVGRARTPD
jgi:alkaline phosphatase D